jgi:cob(I)alamin adenosyltransferase
MIKGLIHVYCGDGKGKTTAAMGLALRAAGSGMKVVFLQFLKGRNVSELNTLTLIPGISVLRNSIDYGFYNTMDDQVKLDITKFHNDNLITAINLINENHCDMLILDELTATYEYGLIDKNVVENLIRNKPTELELVITGRNPDNLFIEYADYISEIKKIKHPYDKGIVARKGIES